MEERHVPRSTDDSAVLYRWECPLHHHIKRIGPEVTNIHRHDQTREMPLRADGIKGGLTMGCTFSLLLNEGPRSCECVLPLSTTWFAF
jgi:hypothetical protein